MAKKIEEKDEATEKKKKYLERHEELELTFKAKCGNKEAWGKLYEHFIDAMIGYINGWIRNIDDAQDLAQDVFIIAEKNLMACKYNPKYRFYVFLRNIAGWVISDYWEMKLGRPSKIFGTISAYDPKAKILELEAGKKKLKFTISDNAKIKGDIKEGEKVTLSYRKEGEERIAIRISVSAQILSSKEEEKKETKEEGGEIEVEGEEVEKGKEVEEALYVGGEPPLSQLPGDSDEDGGQGYMHTKLRTPHRPIEHIEVLELFRLTLGCCVKPHQFLAFGFVAILKWKVQEVVQELSDWILREIADRFFDDYYIYAEASISREAFEEYCSPLLGKLKSPVEMVYPEHEYEKIRKIFPGKPVKEVPLRPFYGERGPAASIADWLYDVKQRARNTVETDISCAG